MKVYIASYFETRERIRQEATKLWDKGYDVVSSWLNEVARPEHMSKKEFWKKLAMKDLSEIKQADLVIIDTFDETPRGGREVELGYSLAQYQSKSIYLVGPVRNVFHELIDRQYPDWKALLNELPTMVKTNDNPIVKKRAAKKKRKK